MQPSSEHLSTQAKARNANPSQMHEHAQRYIHRRAQDQEGNAAKDSRHRRNKENAP
jgi:hypothetical protein